MSKKAEIDKSFERALGAVLRRELAPAGAGCPHPGLLAAYHDHTLTKVESDEIERHVVTCGDCQEQVALFARIESVSLAQKEAPRAQGFVASPKPVAAAERRWRWLAPAALAAAAVLAVSVTYRFAPLISEAKRSALDGFGSPAPSAAGRVDATNSVMADKKANEAPAPPAIADTPVLEGETGKQQNRELRPSGQAVLEKRAVEQSASAPEPTAVFTPVPAPPPVPAALEPTAEKLAAKDEVALFRPRAAAKIERFKEIERSKEVGAIAGAAPRQAARVEERDAAAERRVAPPAGEAVVAARSDAEVQWRLRRTSIERSDDAGKTWQRQLDGARTGLLAGSAPSASVCWVVGRGGVVLRTTDGRTWERVASPGPSDLVHVSAWSAASATVKNVDGERFSTSDGGQTWSHL